MDNLFFVLMVVFFIIAPILEKVLKGARPQQPGRPQPGTQQQRRRLPDGRTTTIQTGTTAPAERDATDLVPAELWEILTGQRNVPRGEPEAPPSRPIPPSLPEPGRETRPVPAVEGDLSSWAEGAARHNLEAVDEVQRRRERERRSYRAPTPVVQSLETEPLPAAKRHAAYHDKVDHLTPAETVRGRPVQHDLDLDFGDASSLRRAIILQEVLGRPKGMD